MDPGLSTSPNQFPDLDVSVAEKALFVKLPAEKQFLPVSRKQPFHKVYLCEKAEICKLMGNLHSVRHSNSISWVYRVSCGAHSYLNLFSKAGYFSNAFIASSNAVVYCYVMYLIGKYEYHVKSVDLNKLITKWIYMTTVTYFYTGSTESTVESMFADLRDIKTDTEYVKYLEDYIAGRFTDDYFNVTLPKGLETSSTVSPTWMGYIAAINVLGKPMLFSTEILSKYLIPGANGDKKAIDCHHIFPKHYLEEQGFKDDRDRNQVANYTYLDYVTNIDISDKPPMEYVGEYREKLGEEEYQKTCAENALPEGFENMEYMDFLAARRNLMAQIIRRGYERLCL